MAATASHNSCDVPALREVHSSKIGAHHAMAGYEYPIVRLPVAFSRLIGLPIRIYATVCDGAFAFLVVVARDGAASNNAKIRLNTSVFTRRSRLLESGRSIIVEFYNAVVFIYNETNRIIFF